MSARLSQPAPWKYVPWHIEESDNAVRDANGDLVCTTAGSDLARLIAAAPDLLEMCQMMAAEFSNEDGVFFERHPAVSELLKAIAKATGTTP